MTYFDLAEWRKTEAHISASLVPVFCGPVLKPLWQATSYAVHILYTTCAQHGGGGPCSHTEDQRSLMWLGGRALTNTLAAVRLVLAGYYGPAIALVRDNLESTMLIQLFRERPHELAVWRTATSDERWNAFRPAKLKRKLNAHNVWHRHEEWEEYSELAGHPNPRASFLAYSPKHERRMVGPFTDEKVATHVVLQITLAACDACYQLLAALQWESRFADEWKAVEEAFDEWSAKSDKSDGQRA